MTDDPGNRPPPNDDLQKKRALADEASELLNNKAFQQAVSQLRMRWYEEMMTTLDRAQRDELTAMSKALRGITDELGVIVNNYKMAVHNNPRQRHG